MVHRLATRAGCLNGNREILLHFVLADELAQPLRAQLEFK
jgi:hypothetical protein